MKLQSPLRRCEELSGHSGSECVLITWEPQLQRTQFRRRQLEQATIIELSPNGALIRARTNSAITRGTRVAIGRRNQRGLVAVRRVEPAAGIAMSDYAVQFLWLDPAMQALFDEAVSTDTPFDFEYR